MNKAIAEQYNQIQTEIETLRDRIHELNTRIQEKEQAAASIFAVMNDIILGETIAVETRGGRRAPRRFVVDILDRRFKWASGRIIKKDGSIGRAIVHAYSNWQLEDKQC